MTTSFTRGFGASLMVVLIALVSFSEARQHLVGGNKNPWKIPHSKHHDSFNRWASLTRFLIGDSLVFKYDGSKDSVLQVHKENYMTCNTSSPIASHNDGNTEVKLDHSGPYYFISGANGHCNKGQKIIIVVLAERHARVVLGASPAPSPYAHHQHQAPTIAPAMAPASNAALLKGTLVATFALGVVSFLLM
ncbi:hypothetical protein Leryth_008543 [Lithospermum erythrorhizon]|uniref:Phytocyanin domain-containing protein n=1 Tax=Lithospermum erythrorhizon TaxID=34254 RepID=A0AAV3R6X2_LITER|nr:hypothetical protein Leryth_008543 [Lithospermum erythrorhizon]